MPRFVTNADYEEKDAHPLSLVAGDEVTVGPVDRAWPGWVWVVDGEGRRGYVPEAAMEPLGEGRFAMMEDFDSTVLKVSRGDSVESIRIVHGWHWCRHADGGEGWVTDYLLSPV
ncbi:MAG: SH3 domain-containing protein [Haloferula sp.]